MIFITLYKINFCSSVILFATTAKLLVDSAA